MRAKKVISMILAGALACSLAACGGDGSAESGETSAAREEAQEETPASQEKVQEEPAESPGEEENGAANGDNAQTSGGNVLIAYFSVPEDINTDGIDADAGASVVVEDGKAVGNMQFMAESIRQAVGGELFRIETKEEYPLDHDPLVDQAADEQDADARPELSSHIENLEQYDTIFVGFPKLVPGF